MRRQHEGIARSSPLPVSLVLERSRPVVASVTDENLYVIEFPPEEGGGWRAVFEGASWDGLMCSGAYLPAGRREHRLVVLLSTAREDRPRLEALCRRYFPEATWEFSERCCANDSEPSVAWLT